MFNSQNCGSSEGLPMGLLSKAIAEKQAAKSSVMYSVNGAMWQESAIARIDYKGSEAHKAIGSLVTAINNNTLTVQEAESQFVALLGKA